MRSVTPRTLVVVRLFPLLPTRVNSRETSQRARMVPDPKVRCHLGPVKA